MPNAKHLVCALVCERPLRLKASVDGEPRTGTWSDQSEIEYGRKRGEPVEVRVAQL